jgi:hypothetical protein
MRGTTRMALERAGVIDRDVGDARVNKVRQ